MTSILSIGASEIHELDGLFSLNDLHTAGGRLDHHRPSKFLANKKTKELIAELTKARIRALETKHGGSQGSGTYACKELVIAYAAWISAAFHLKVIRVFLAQSNLAADVKSAPVPPLPSVGITGRKWILSIDGDGESLTPIDRDSVVTKLDALPGLIRSQNNPFNVAQLTAIGQACLEQMASRFQDLGSRSGQGGASGQSPAARHEPVNVMSRVSLLTASINENLRQKFQRPAISFWSAAEEIVNMRHQLESERGEVMSASEFANVLAADGMKVDRATLAMYEFAVKFYANFEHRNEFTRDDIRNVLRPGYTLIRDLWAKHGKVDSFDSSYLQWVAMVALPKYSVNEFLASLNASAASALGYSSEQFAALLAAFELDRDAVLADLLEQIN